MSALHPHARAAETSPLARTLHHDGLEVLLCDQDATRRDEVAAILSAAGHVVDTYASEDDAVTSLEERARPIVVLAPQYRPTGAQLGVLNWMRLRHPTSQVIVLARPEIGAGAAAIANSGASALVHTPVSRDELLSALTRAAALYEQRELARIAMEERYVRRRHLDALSHIFETALVQMNLVYQPIIRARTGCVLAFEALLRTNYMRLQGAGPMLGLARRLGRQAEVDDRVRSLVAIALEETTQPRTVFVNFHMDELGRGILGTAQDPLRPYANRVVVELSHEGPLDDSPALRRTLEQAREAGYRFAAGGIAGSIGGLSRMRVLAPDVYKLGAGVVQGCDRDEEKQRLIREMVDLAHADGALVVAQGIERPEEREVVGRLGCDLLQGFFLGVPRAAFD